MGLRIVPQVLEEAVPQSDHCIVLINQYVANRGSHVFSECRSKRPSNAEGERTQLASAREQADDPTQPES